MAYLALVCAMRAADSEMALNDLPGIAVPPPGLAVDLGVMGGRGVGEVLNTEKTPTSSLGKGQNEARGSKEGVSSRNVGRVRESRN